MTWFVYDLYPEGKGNLAEELNKCRLKTEKTLRSETDKYRWFTILHPPGRVKIGIDENGVIKKIKEELKIEYPSIQIENGSENYCDLMAIASEARTVIEDKIAGWNIRDTSLLVHFMLNPYNYNFEANIHIMALLNIKEKVSGDKLKEIINLIETKLKNIDA